MSENSRSLLDYFGFKFLNNKETSVKDTAPTFSKPIFDDGASAVLGGQYGTYLDMGGVLTNNEAEQIRKYREISLYPETAMALDDIVGDAICENEVGEIVKLEILDDNIDPRIKRKLIHEFENVLDLLNFDTNGSDIFRRWYIEGKLAYHIIIDPNDVKSGINALRQIDATNIRKIVEFEEKPSVHTGTNLIRKVDEYFLYVENGFAGSTVTTSVGSANTTNGLKISPDTILYSTCGLVDANSVTISVICILLFVQRIYYECLRTRA